MSWYKVTFSDDASNNSGVRCIRDGFHGRQVQDRARIVLRQEESHDEDGDFLPCDCYEAWAAGERPDYGTVTQKYPAQLVLQDVPDYVPAFREKAFRPST